MGRGNHGQMFGGNIQFNRGGGAGTHRGGGGVQIHQADVGPVRRRLARSPAQHQEGKTGVVKAQEVAKEGGGRAVSLIKVLPRGSSGSDLVWSGDMGGFGINYSAVRGSACGLPAEGHTKKAMQRRDGSWQ